MKSRGFTIVELLIVIVVIGILAGIVIIAYNGIQQNARVASLQSDLDNASRKLKLYQVDNANYPVGIDCSASPATNTICLKPSNGITYTTFSPSNSTTPQTFCLTATASNNTNYFITQDGSPVSGACTITNLVTNPTTTDINQWATYGGGIGGGGLPVNLTREAVGWSTSGYAMRATATAGAISTMAEIGLRNSPITTPLSGKVSASIFIKASTNRTGYLRVRPSTGGDKTSSAINVTTTPQRFDFFVTGLQYGTTFGLTYKDTSGTFNTGDWVEASQAMIVEGSTLFPYADGSSPGWSWSGAANASTSTGPPL